MHIVTSGPWGTLASAFFFLAALFGGDVLVLRGCLLLAYLFLLINGVAGLPAWPWAAASDRISVDMICWAIAAGALHGCAVVRMLWDELPVRYATEDDRQLAVFFSRRSGMEPLEAKQSLKYGHWMRVAAGHRIVDSVQLNECVYLLVEGCCSYASPCCASSHGSPQRLSPASRVKQTTQHTCAEQEGQDSTEQQKQQPVQQPNLTQGQMFDLSLTRSVSLEQPLQHMPSGSLAIDLHSLTPSIDDDTSSHSAEQAGFVPAATTLEGRANGSPNRMKSKLLSSRMMRSGHIFSLSALNVFGVYIASSKFGLKWIACCTGEHVLSWPMSSLEKMAMACSPALAAYWRNFIMYSIASEFELRAHRRMMLCRCSTGELEHDSWLQGGRSRDLTDPPRSYERTCFTLERFLRWLKKAISPIPPPGIRHTALPLTGVMARTRAMTVAEAKVQAARSKDISVKMGLSHT